MQLFPPPKEGIRGYPTQGKEGGEGSSMKERKTAVLPCDHKRMEYQEYIRCLEAVVMILAVACIILGCVSVSEFARLQMLGVFG